MSAMGLGRYELDEIRQSVDEFEADIKAFAKELSKKAIKSKSLMD